MGWRNSTYFYSIRVLKRIGQAYSQIYEGLSFREGNIVTNPWLIAEYKADFDIALKSVGRGSWDGEIDRHQFKDFRRFGRLQQIIIADILGVPDSELLRLGFYDIPRLRGYAYYLMARKLNGDEFVGEN